MEVTEPTQAVEAPPNLLFQLLRAARTLTDRLDHALQRMGMSLPALDLLSELVNATEPPRVRELATGAGADGSGVAALIQGLEQDGLVRRMPDAASSSARIVITARGRARHRAGAEQVAAVRQQLAQALAGVDAVAVERALAALR